MSKISVIFPGQGSQVVGMGLKLYENHLKAKEVFNIVDEALALAEKDLVQKQRAQ